MVADFAGTVGGRSYEAWLALWHHCHEGGMSGPVLRAWPDGGSLLSQPALMVNMFDLIEGQVIAEAKSKRA